jgi:hypothetical protein
MTAPQGSRDVEFFAKRQNVAMFTARDRRVPAIAAMKGSETNEDNDM